MKDYKPKTEELLIELAKQEEKKQKNNDKYVGINDNYLTILYKYHTINHILNKERTTSMNHNMHIDSANSNYRVLWT